MMDTQEYQDMMRQRNEERLDKFVCAALSGLLSERNFSMEKTHVIAQRAIEIGAATLAFIDNQTAMAASQIQQQQPLRNHSINITQQPPAPFIPPNVPNVDGLLYGQEIQQATPSGAKSQTVVYSKNTP